jgi:hypothetical protein
MLSLKMSVSARNLVYFSAIKVNKLGLQQTGQSLSRIATGQGQQTNNGNISKRLWIEDQ